MDFKEQAIRELYDARARRDWDAARMLLADEVGWHEPGEEDHCWSAERDGMRSEGNEIAVYRFRDSKIAQVWFHVDGFDPEAFSAVFRYE